MSLYLGDKLIAGAEPKTDVVNLTDDQDIGGNKNFTGTLRLNYKDVAAVDTYKNGNNWYRVWSDGWIEQGGILNAADGGTAVTFLKPFSDTNYIALVTANNNSPSYNVTGTVSKATSSFKPCKQAGGIISWYACGY